MPVPAGVTLDAPRSIPPGITVDTPASVPSRAQPSPPQSAISRASDLLGSFADSSGLSSIGHAIAHPIDTATAVGKTLLNPYDPDGIGGKIAIPIVQNAVTQGKSAVAAAKQGSMGSALSHAVLAVPALGPILQKAMDQSPDDPNKGYLGNLNNLLQNPGAVGTLLGGAASPILAERAGAVVKNLVNGPAPVPGQNYTPAHAAAFEGLTAKATGMGNNFIPQNLTSDALSPIRQSAADMLANGNPTEQAVAQTATGTGVKPIDRLGAVHNIIQRSLSDLEGQHAPVLSRVAGTPVDMTPIQQGLKAQIRPGMSTADIAGINDLIDRAGQINNIGDLNGFRQIMNEEASPSYRQSPTQAGRASAPQQVANDTANAVRQHYFDQMQQATASPQNPNGIDFQPLKAKESQLLTTKEAIERLQSPEARAEATFNAPSTLKEKAGNIANIIKEPRTTVTQTILRESPATRSANLIKQALKDLPSASPVSSSVAPPTPPAINPATANLPPALQRILQLSQGGNQ